MAVSPARAAAFDVLLRVETEAAYAMDVLHGGRLRKLSLADRALCTQLVMGVLRWQSRLDDAIANLAGAARMAKLDPEVLIALRLAVFQIGFLERIPARAAVNESVELVKRAHKRSAAPFVNAVLRKLTPACVKAEPPLGPDATAAALARFHAHPLWLVESWFQQYGAAITQKICEHDQTAPATVLRIRASANPSSVEAEMQSDGVETAPGELMNHARLVVSGDGARARAFIEGRVAIQDEASQLAAALVGQGEHILDCCAAPGGKTSAIAERNPASQIMAVELHPHRARLMQSLIQARNVQVIAADARHLPFATRFDRVLADVPCSGTGTLARNPEIKWRLKPADLQDLAARQSGILDAALNRVREGGRLVYSTCSLEDAENAAVVRSVLANRSEFRLLDCREELRRLQNSGELVWRSEESLCAGPFLRTIPGLHPCDGFFAAIIARN